MSSLMPVLFALIALGLLVLLTWYTPRRLAKLLGLRRRWPAYLTAGAVVAFFVTSWALVPRSPSCALGVFATVAGVLVCLQFFLGISLLLTSALQRVARVSDRATLFLAVVLALVTTGMGVRNAYTLEVVEAEIPVPGLEEDVTVAHIADVHLGPHRGEAWLRRIVEEVNAGKPDFVLLNGDLIEGGVALENGALAPLGDIEAPTYFVTGNHDAHVDTERALKAITDRGVRVLRNEAVATHGLHLVGLEYMRADDRTYDPHAVNDLTIESELPKIRIPDAKPILLMHHSPVGIEYAAKGGVSLMVSGHTHAGQVWPATWIAKIAFPYLEGLYEEDGLRVFVSQGAGTFGVPLRLGSSNQIDWLRLRAAR